MAGFWSKLFSSDDKPSSAQTAKDRLKVIVASEQGLGKRLSQEKIDQIAVWRDSRHFDLREKIVLALTEDLTRIHTNFPNHEIMEEAKKHFTKNEIILIVTAIANINAWNRLGVGLGF